MPVTAFCYYSIFGRLGNFIALKSDAKTTILFKQFGGRASKVLLLTPDVEDTDEEVGSVDKEPLLDGKIGAKKQRKLEEKAERKAQREVKFELYYLYILISNNENLYFIDGI